MKELVEVIAKALVDNPEEVVVTESEKEDEIVIELKVAAYDEKGPIGQGTHQRFIVQDEKFLARAAAKKEG